MSSPQSINSSVCEETEVMLRETTASLHNSSLVLFPHFKVFTYIYAFFFTNDNTFAVCVIMDFKLTSHCFLLFCHVLFYCKFSLLCRRTPVNELLIFRIILKREFCFLAEFSLR